MSADRGHRRTDARRVGRIALRVLMLVVMAGSALWLVPGSFGLSPYVMTGGSMGGSYDKGSIVYEEPVAVGDLRIGDVITYLPPASSGVTALVTHRIVDIRPAASGGALVVTQGDHDAAADPWSVTLEDAQPVVRAGVPYAGWVFIALADPQTRTLVLGGPAALVLLLGLTELVGAQRDRRHPSTSRDHRPVAA